MISKEEVIHIAKLARLELTEEEIERMQKDLSAILDYFNALQAAPQNYAEQTRNFAENLTLRKDEVEERRPSLAGDLVKAAPEEREGYVKVKAIL